MTDHTPKPWRILYGHDGALPIANRSGLILARVEMPRMSTPAEWVGNAELIVSAPDLLEQRDELLAALEAMLIEMDTPDLQCGWQRHLCTQARIAIAKVRGD